MLADDLVGLIALGAPGALVPRRDHAAWIEHEDRVIRDALDEQTEALGLPASLDIGLEHAGATLQLADDPEAREDLVRRADRQHVRMGAAHALVGHRAGGAREAVHYIPTEERERVPLGEIVPQMLEPYGCLGRSGATEQVDHLSVDVRTHARPALAHPAEEPAERSE